MSLLLMTLQAWYFPVPTWIASFTMAYVPLPRVFPVRYWRAVRKNVLRKKQGIPGRVPLQALTEIVDGEEEMEAG